MRLYKTGDLCPCCGQPIRLESPEALEVFSIAAALLGFRDEKEEFAELLFREAQEQEGKEKKQ